MTDLLWVLLVLAIVIWLVTRRPAESQVPSSRPLTFEPETLVDDADELEVRQAREARDEIAQQEAAAADRHTASMKQTREKIAKARKYVRDAGLDRDIPQVWEAVQHWPTWVKLTDPWAPPAGVSAISGEGDHKACWVAWRWRDHDYKVSFDEKQNYFPDDYDRLAEISLEVDGLVVCAVSCSQGEEAYGSWSFSDVDALKVGGWMTDFVRLAAHLRAEQEALSRDTFSEYEKEKAGRIDLGE